MTNTLGIAEQGNMLFPVFFRLDQLKLLVVGGGMVGLEKVNSIYKNSPNANVTLVAPEIRKEIKELAIIYKGLKLVERDYNKEDLEEKDLLIVATCINDLNKRIKQEAKEKNILINVADTPNLCDFYLGSVVKKGDLKIAISTNGKSPTFAKRVRELLEEILPENIQTVLDNLAGIRNKLKGDFEYKIKKLDEITSVMKDQKTLE